MCEIICKIFKANEMIKSYMIKIVLMLLYIKVIHVYYSWKVDLNILLRTLLLTKRNILRPFIYAEYNQSR